jgi:hypothetical protein
MLDHLLQPSELLALLVMKTAADGDTKTYNVGVTGGTAGNLSYAWTVTGNGTVSGGATGATVDVDLTTGSATVTCALLLPVMLM